MNKKVIVLNGAARKNGSTAKLVEARARGWSYLPEIMEKQWLRLPCGFYCGKESRSSRSLPILSG